MKGFDLFLTILKTMLPVQRHVILEIVILFIKYLYLFICMFYSNHHIEIISSTINVNKSNIPLGEIDKITTIYR
jgi:hypothetical protein